MRRYALTFIALTCFSPLAPAGQLERLPRLPAGLMAGQVFGQPQTAATHRKTLDGSPKDVDAFLGLLRALEPGEPRDDLGPRFLKLEEVRRNFDLLSDECILSQDVESLVELTEAMKKIDVRHVQVDYAQALCKIWSRKFNEGVPLFKEALARQELPTTRQRWMQNFIGQMVNAGRSAEAYSALPDAEEAFRLVAPQLRYGRHEELGELIKLHSRKHDDDPLLPFYQGEFHVNQGKFELAAKAFARGMENPPDRNLLEQFRHSRVRVLYQTGQAMRAYNEIEPKEVTFQDLASMFFGDRKYDPMEKLLDAHAKNNPDSLSLQQFRYRIKIKQGKVKDGIALFEAAYAKAAGNTRTRELNNFLMDMVDADLAFEGYQAAPDALKAYQFLAQDLMGQNQREQLQKVTETHRQNHPDDPWLTFFAAEKHFRERSFDKALPIYEEILDKGPAELKDRSRWSHISTLFQLGQGLEAYKKFAARDQVYDQLVQLCVSERKGKELEELVAARRAMTGDSADLQFHLARAKILLKQPDLAIRLYRRACNQQTNTFLVRSYTENFVRDMAGIGEGLEAYRSVVGNKTRAFQVVARSLINKKQTRELALLLAEHGQKQSQDPWLHFYKGELHLLSGEIEQAERAFAAAYANARPRDDLWSFRNGIYRARVKAGRVLAAYKEFGPSRRIFDDLAYACLNLKEAGQLEALVAARRMEDAEDSGLSAWDLEVLWVKKDYVGAINFIKKHRVGPTDRNYDWNWKSSNYLVRGLVRLGRFEEAIREAEAMLKNKNLSSTMLILAHASTGNVKKTMAAVDRFATDRFLVEDCYRDEDLGPILRGKSFQAFRDRFPEPKRLEIEYFDY